jgi:hypothetical protein
MALDCMDMIDAVASGRCQPALSTFQSNLRAIVEKDYHGTVAAYARRACMHHSSLNDLLRHLVRPGLDTLLQLAAASSLTVKEFIGQPGAWRRSGVLGTEIRTLRRTCRRYDWKNVSTLIEQEIVRERLCTSLRSICRKQVWDSGYVAAKLPLLARDLIHRFRGETRKRHQKREEDERSNLQATMSCSSLSSEFPSYRRLKKVLITPGSLRNPEIRTLRKQLLANGLKNRGDDRR